MNYWQSKNLYDRMRKRGKYAPEHLKAATDVFEEIETHSKNRVEESVEEEPKPPKKTRKQELAELIEWPEHEEMQRLVETDYPTAIAQQLGVTLTNLKAYCSKFKIKIPATEFFFQLGERLPRDSEELASIRHPRDSAKRPVTVRPKTSDRYEDLIEIIEYCKSGDIYAVEDWIALGYPIQLVPDEKFRWANRRSPLRAAIESGNRSLAGLLLVNGYDPNLRDEVDQYDLFEYKRIDLVHLLLDYGYDWTRLHVSDVLRTYDDSLINRLVSLGLDVSEDDRLADALCSGVIAPLARFVRTWKAESPERIVPQLTIGLRRGVERKDLTLVRTMMSLGADPYLKVYDEDSGLCYERNAIEAAAWETNFTFWKALKVNLARIDKADIFSSAIHARNEKVYRLIFDSLKPGEIDGSQGAKVISSIVSTLASENERRASDPSNREEALVLLLRDVVKLGFRWSPEGYDTIAFNRRTLLRCSEKAAATVIAIFRDLGGASEEDLKKLCSTPAIRRHVHDIQIYENALNPPKPEVPVKRKRGRPRKVRTE